MKISKEEYRTLVERSAILDVIVSAVRSEVPSYEVDSIAKIAGKLVGQVDLPYESVDKDDESAADRS